LTSEAKKGFLLVELSAGSGKAKEHFFKTKYAIDKAVILQSNNKPEDLLYIGFISRKDLIAGIIELKNYKQRKITNQIKLSSFPSELYAEDLNNDGTSELIVCGANFNGISILYSSGKSFSESKFESGKFYSQIYPADFNNDSFTDILAYDYLSRKIKFFYNYGNASFYKVKEINNVAAINMLKYYRNSIYTSNDNAVEIYHKNKEGVYNFSGRIKSQFEIDDFLINDFNDDGISGIACLNKTKSRFSLFFGKKDGGFSDEYIPITEKGIEDFCRAKAGTSEDLIILTGTGLIIKLNNDFNKLSEEKLGLDVTTACTFENFGKNEKGLCFYDKYNKSFYVAGINRKGIITTLYSTKVFSDIENIVVDNSKPKKQFYCYAKGKKSLDIITFNPAAKKFELQTIYMQHPIYNAWTANARKKILFLIVKNNNSFETGRLDIERGEYQYKRIKTFNSSFSNYVIGANKLIFTTSNAASQIDIYDFNKSSLSEVQGIDSASGSILLDGSNFSLPGKLILINGKGEIKAIDILNKETLNLNVYAKNLLYFNNINDFVFEINKDSAAGNCLFFFNKKNKQFCKLSYSNNEFRVRALFTEDDVKEFSVISYDKKNLFIVYAGKKNINLRIKRIINED